MSQYDWLRKWVADYKEKTGINVESPLKPIDYGLQYIKLGDYWATQYKYFPTDVRFEGSMNERITHLKQRGYGNDMINYWIIEGDKLVNEHKRSLERTKKPDSVFVSDHSVYSDPTKYLVHGLIPSIPSVQAATAVRVPDSVSISVSPSENTVLLNLTPHKDGGSPILSYHIILRNQTTGQEIRLTLHQTTRTLIQNLDSGTNYTVYAIAVNAVGNSPENSISFKTDESTIAIPTPTPTPEPIPPSEEIPIGVPDVTPTIDKSINSMMVSQSIGAFILKDGRVKGEILYIANQSFNPYYYGKNLTSLVQIKSKTGIGIAIKPNNLNFTHTQRDERIQIDEAVGNFKELLIDFFVWDTPLSMQIFSETKQIQVVEELPPSENGDEFKPCQIGYHKDFSGKCVPDDPQGEIPRDKLMDTLKGFLFGTIALSLLARKY